MIIRTIIVAIILLFKAALPAQSQDIDSLKALLKGKTNQNRIDILYGLSYNLIEVDNRLALRYALEGYNSSFKLNDSLRIVRTGLVAASALRRLQKLDSSIQIYYPIIFIAEKKKYLTELSIALNSMGVAYSQKAQYDKALGCYYRALEMRRSGRDTLSQIAVLNNIGAVYYKLKNYQKALGIFQSCKEMERDLILSRAQNDMSEMISTIHGLCSNGLREVSEPVAHIYIKRIAESNNRLVNCLRSTVMRSVSATSI